MIYYTHVLKPSFKEGFSCKEAESLFSKKKLDEFNALSDSRKIEKILIHKSIRKILNVIFENKSVAFEIIKEDSGKPTLNVESEKSPLFLSYSHSDISVFVALSKEVDIGVDIEEIKRIESHKAFTKWLHTDELAYLDKKDIKALTSIWTRKESLAKLSSLGYKMTFKTIKVFPENEIVFTKKNAILRTLKKGEELCSIAHYKNDNEVLFKEIS